LALLYGKLLYSFVFLFNYLSYLSRLALKNWHGILVLTLNACTVLVLLYRLREPLGSPHFSNVPPSFPTAPFPPIMISSYISCSSCLHSLVRCSTPLVASSVPNSLGGLLRASDGTGRLSVLCLGRPKCRTAIFELDGGPYRFLTEEQGLISL